MEKFFTNKKIWKILVIAFLFIMTIQVITPTTVVFAEEESDAEQDGDNVTWAGILMRPIMSLLVTMGDGALYIIHSAIMGQKDVLIPIQLEEGNSIIKFIFWHTPLGQQIKLSLGFYKSIIEIGKSLISGENPIVALDDGIKTAVSTVLSEDTPNTLYLPIYNYSPEEIFQGHILLFNVDFFNKVEEPKEGKTSEGKKDSEGTTTFYYYEDSNGEMLDVDGDGTEDVAGYRTSRNNSVYMLRKTVSTWYAVIRYICIVGMLAVLLYIGIRMMLTSVASEKAKYLGMLKDWLVGLSLLFLMHYIMAFSVTLVQKITDIVSTSVGKNTYTVILYSDSLKDEGKGITDDNQVKKLEDGIRDYHLENYTMTEEGDVLWISNLMGNLRLKLQFDKREGQYIGEIICFLTMVIYTIVFTFIYLKRVLYMAFLTIIAPFVALTYPIDKINDGQAQGFNTWIKEYIFNLLIQPMHLILYYILVTSAFDLAGENVIYSLVAIGFMIPAEKLLRGFFGFEKAHTPPSLIGGAAGTALMMNGIKGITNAIGKSSGDKKDAAGGKAGKEGKIRTPGITRPVNTGDEMAQITNNENDEPMMEQLQEGSSSNSMEGDTTASTQSLNQNEDEEPMAVLPQAENSSNSMEGESTQSLNQNEDEEPVTQNEDHEPMIRLERVDYSDVPGVTGTFNTVQSSNSNTLPRRNISGARGFANNGGATKKLKNKIKDKKAYKIASEVAKSGAKKIGRGALGGAAGLMVGGTLAGLGAAAAIASGDPKNLFAAAGVGLSGGIATGKKVATADPKKLLSPTVRDAIDKVNSRPEYKEDRMNKFIKDARKNERVQQELREIDADIAAKIMENGNFDEFIKRGYSIDREGLKKMVASQKLIDNNENDLAKNITNVDQATAVMKTADRIGMAPSQMKKKDRKDWLETYQEDYEGKGNDPRKMAKRTMDMAQLFYDSMSEE